MLNLTTRRIYSVLLKNNLFWVSSYNPMLDTWIDLEEDPKMKFSDTTSIKT